mmetsp:Transcript_571/g.1807  ORF Transcript_571/g.1807 Transcript_571/m.1807 type:complete len:328 (+) Transcript_571:66-1049(+)
MLTRRARSAACSVEGGAELMVAVWPDVRSPSTVRPGSRGRAASLRRGGAAAGQQGRPGGPPADPGIRIRLPDGLQGFAMRQTVIWHAAEALHSPPAGEAVRAAEPTGQRRGAHAPQARQNLRRPPPLQPALMLQAPGQPIRIRSCERTLARQMVDGAMPDVVLGVPHHGRQLPGSVHAAHAPQGVSRPRPGVRAVAVRDERRQCLRSSLAHALQSPSSIACDPLIAVPQLPGQRCGANVAEGLERPGSGGADPVVFVLQALGQGLCVLGARWAHDTKDLSGVVASTGVRIFEPGCHLCCRALCKGGAAERLGRRDPRNDADVPQAPG